MVLEGYEVAIVVGQRKSSEEQFAEVSRNGEIVRDTTFSAYLLELSGSGWTQIHESRSDDGEVAVAALVRPKN